VAKAAVRLAGLAAAAAAALAATAQQAKPPGAAAAAVGSEPTKAAPAMPAPQDDAALNGAADEYVRLVLAAARHDPAFADGYCGPAAWRADAERGKPAPLVELRARARALSARLRALPASPRREFLIGQASAVEASLLRLSGQAMSLGDEARRLFGIEPPEVSREDLDDARARVDAAVAGDRSLPFRVDLLRKEMRVKRERLPAVMEAALAMLRSRTEAVVELPAGERVRVEYVTGKPWRAHATYLGGFATRIEVNTDAAFELGDVLQLAAREGYPGHHAIETLRDAELARGRGWHEYWVHPPDSPESVVTEGAAAVGLGVVMDTEAQRAFLRDVLTPLAGLRTYDLADYGAYLDAARPLRRANVIAVRMLLDDGRPDAEVEDFLERVGLRTTAEAKMALAEYRAVGAFVLARSAGEDLAAAWVGTGPDRVARFLDLVRRPMVPRDLAAGQR
jgi:hypothetical protein